MSDYLIGAIVALAFALFSIRPVTSDSRTPAELRDAVRHLGARRTLLAALRITLIVVLLLLVEACRIGWQATACIAFVLTVLAHGIDALSRNSIDCGRPA